ncbi:MAG: hypothetical protein FJ098_08055 [Deltaproteobacteria bacterium]|nr:hypothetical protein [Deltaproteobacteria bacterium]
MRRKFMRELAAMGLPRSPAPNLPLGPVTEADLEPLPEAVRRYLRFMGVVGRARDWSFRLAFDGRFRRTRDEAWMKCQAWQYNTRARLARIFHIRIRFGGVVPVLGRDTYLRGRGRMHIRLLDLVTVADGTGEAYDVGELVTYLNDGIFIAPSMLLVPEARWSPVDGSMFEVALTDLGRTVVARVFIDERGAPVNFETTDRFYSDPKDPPRTVRMRWSTPVEGWRELDGRQLWTRGRAVWHTPEGEFPYADFTPVPGTLAFNVAPGE